VKQILDIAAVLPGQAPQRKFSIPALSRTNTNDPAAAGNPAMQQSNSNLQVSRAESDLQQKQQTFSDLVDVNNSVPNKEADVKAHNANYPPQLPVEELPLDKLQLDKPPSDSESLSGKKAQEEFPEDMRPSKLLNFVKDDHEPRRALRRLDTETKEEEHFHDAHS
jgi:hypothetical protein